jgi:CheY-like chemotaxis protein
MQPPDLNTRESIPNARILVVDDEPSSAKVVKKHLLDAGYEDVVTSSEPSEVMALIAENQPDLILLDVVMPGISGLKILERIRCEEQLTHLPVIILTASSELHVKARALALGVTDFLQKPIDSTDLIPRVRNALSIRALRLHCESLASRQAECEQETTALASPNDLAEPQSNSQCPSPILETPRQAFPSWRAMRQSWFREVKSAAKVMIVDDEPINIKVLRKYLAAEGYQHFTTTTDATETLELIDREKPDVILLDIMMPKISGLEILDEVRAKEEYTDLPVIILTASTDQATKERALDLGATEFLTKPIDPTDVLPRVRNSLVIKLHQDYIKDYARQLEREVAGHIERVKEFAAALERTNEVLRRSRAAAQSASRFKSQFLANMSHEIRTPLSAMIGYAEVMLAESDAKKMSEKDLASLDTIIQNGKHLLRIINNILDLSKIEAGELDIECLSCSPTEILSETLRCLRVQADNKGLAFEAELATAVPEQIQSDPTYLRRILLNLVGNALKFTEQGSVRVVMGLVEQDDDQGKLQFEVVDTGIGIHPDQLAKLFRPYVQANVSVGRRFGGTGLGLSITKQLVEKLGGEVSVESEPGRGSTFRVVIPTGPVNRAEIVEGPLEFNKLKRQEDATGADSSEEPKLDCRILLAEDCLDNQRLMSLLLRKAGAEVVMVNNGQAACEETLKAHRAGTPFDLILMDMQMPVLDGYQATRRLRQEGCSLPIIAITAHVMNGEREKCLAHGCSDYITKPITRQKLLDIVVRHMEEDTTQSPAQSGEALCCEWPTA